MSTAVRIEPDLQFIQDLQAVGGDNLKKCYQCATCSVACPLSPADAPYPRKEMVWAQWGLKEKLLTDIDIWLCHNCGTCSELCPRGAKPADLISALRNMAYKSFMGPGFIGTWMSSQKYLPLLIALPAVLWLVVWYLTTGLTIPDGTIVFAKVYPGDYTIDPIMMITLFSALGILGLGVSRMLRAFSHTPGTYVIGKQERPALWQAVQDVMLGDIMSHSKFRTCGEQTPADADKFTGHRLVFYSFIALAIVTSVIAIGHWGGKVIEFISPMGHTPLHLLNPVKILANIGAVALLVGLFFLTRRRMQQDRETSSSSYYDWYLLGLIWAVTLTGVFSQLLRLADVAILAYPMYYLHLVAVWMLFAYLPWSKLGHVVYRTVALIYARYTGRVPLDDRQN